MQTRTLFLAVAVCGAMVGCATGRPGLSKVICNTPMCKVTVKVADCVITAEPETIEIKGRNREIHWELDQAAVTAGYTFSDTGVWIKDYDKTREFHDPMRLTPTTFRWHDKNSFQHDYKYGITVMKGPATCPDLDPWIANN